MMLRIESVVREVLRVMSAAVDTTLNNTAGNRRASIKLNAKPVFVENVVAIPSIRDATGWTMTAALANAAVTTMMTTAAISIRELSLPMEERTGSITRSRPGAPARITMLSCGHAFTQSMQRVQSMLPTFCGMNS